MKYSVLIAAVLCQIAVQIGSDCSFGSGDEFACSINFFLTCVKDKWILQNTCTTACKDDSTLNWQCFRNRVNSARITTTASATTTTQDITRTQTPLASASLDSKASTASDQTYGAQPATFTIVLICIGTIIAVGLFIFFFFRFGRSGCFFTTSGQRLELDTPVGVLKQMYVVIKPYLQNKSDEVALYTGNQIELYVLYNDGWAKALNVTTGESGLIPVTHLDILEIDANRPPRTRFPSNGSQSRLFIL